MKNIHVLPTDKPTILFVNNEKLLLAIGFSVGTKKNKGQNIYITSDEYIGLSYYLDGSLVRKGVVDDKDYWEVRKDYKKIILTTDQDLIKDGVQAIDYEFLEWFVKNPSCEKVEVTFNNRGITGAEKILKTFGEYKIIIPEEEPKQEKFEHILYKGNVWEPPVQETLEEVAERYYEDEISINAFINGYKVAQEQFKNK